MKAMSASTKPASTSSQWPEASCTSRVHDRYGERGRLSREALYEIGGRDDRDVPEWVEREQIGVAGDDQVGMAVYRRFQEFVIRGIAARHDPLGNGDRLGVGRQFCQPSPSVGVDQRVKVRAGDNPK